MPEIRDSDWIDHSQRRSESAQAEQRLSGSLLAVDTTRPARLHKTSHQAQRSHQRPSAMEHSLTPWPTAWEKPHGASRSEGQTYQSASRIKRKK